MQIGNNIVLHQNKKLLKDGTASIFVRVTFGRLSAEVATGKSVLPSQWVATKGRAKGNTLKIKQGNAFLDQMEYTLHDLTLQIQREGKQESAKEILNRYKNHSVPKIGILALYAEHNQKQKELVGISVSLGLGRETPPVAKTDGTPHGGRHKANLASEFGSLRHDYRFYE